MAELRRDPGAPHGAGWRTVDDLAKAAGTTTRQVRALQTRGLLPRPHLVGRTGYYDAEHLARLRAVLRLQERGFSLAAIVTLVGAWEAGMTLADVLGMPAGSVVASEEPDVFAGYRPSWRGLLSVVPTTVLEEPAAS